MTHDSFDIRAFLESVDLTETPFQLLMVEPTSEPNAFTVTVEPRMTPEQRAAAGNPDLKMSAWVLWMPQLGILRMHLNLHLGEDSIGEERLGLLKEGVNHLNSWSWDTISATSVHKDENQNLNICQAAFSLFIPSQLLVTEEGVSLLRVLLGANLARLVFEGAATSAELHGLLKQNGIAPPAPVEESIVRH